MDKKILFVSHKKAQCGVYEYGRNITDAIQHSKRYQFVRAECSSAEELKQEVLKHKPNAIIYNYYESVMPWVTKRIGPKLSMSNVSSINVPQIGIIHEVTQQVADTAVNYKNRFLLGTRSKNNLLFDYYIAPDPTLLLFNPLVYKTGRLIPSYKNNYQDPAIPTIGSFGFGTPKKGFEKIVEMVQQEFDEALIRFNIPSADFGDKKGENARAIAAKCRALVHKPGIELIITHDFMDNGSILNFLAQNSMNVFLYEDKTGRGLSSALDLAMAVKRPIAVSDAVMFRHVFNADPSICVTKNNLRTILNNGFTPLKKYYDEWNELTMVWEYERILDSILTRPKYRSGNGLGILTSLRSRYKRIFSIPDHSFTWLRNTEKKSEDDMTVNRTIQYTPVQLPAGVSLNRILDKSARQLFEPAIKKLHELAPKTMAKKIPEANVQQAFVFDTVHRFVKNNKMTKILCVGCYEDTASMGLMKMGYTIDEIDPVINYTLQEYTTKPSTNADSYDIIFSTSVIEHDPDDGSFVQCIQKLLVPGGVAVITCDYKDSWKPGDLKPDVDVRLYTKDDLKNRLLSLMDNCRLVDEPQWECENPDFTYLERYQYTFASFVVQKN